MEYLTYCRLITGCETLVAFLSFKYLYNKPTACTVQYRLSSGMSQPLRILYRITILCICLSSSTKNFLYFLIVCYKYSNSFLYFQIIFKHFYLFV